MYDVPLLIEGRDRAAAGDARFERIGPTERRARLLRAADLLASKREDFCERITHETGGTHHWGRLNVDLARRMLREAAAMTTQIGVEVLPSDIDGSLALAIRQPAGAVLGIAPWNAPVILGVRALAMPLACGNTVVLKASEICPATHHLIGTVLQQAGLGDGVVNVITHDPKQAEPISAALIEHPAVRRINFTGSTRVGRILAERAARCLKPILLELGGKAPLILLDDADLDAAVAATVFGAFANQGQICMSTERVLVHESVADAFVDKLAARVTRVLQADPGTSSGVLGAMVEASAAECVHSLVSDAVARGAVRVVGGAVAGPFLPATVVDRVTPEMQLFREESFGPQVSITRVQSDAEEIALANDSEYGLSASIFSRDIARAIELAKRIHSGMCHINGPTVHDEPQMPFGGTKASGHGRFGGRAAIAEFTRAALDHDPDAPARVSVLKASAHGLL